MRTKILTLFLILLFAGAAWAKVDSPHEVGAFVLGKPIAEIQNRLKMDTVMPVRYRGSIREVEIQPTPVFKTGLIWYGTCTDPERIIRIRLKYRDSSEEMYKQLLSRIKDRFGQPDEWRGDPFHRVIGWKWGFEDADGNRISMILQHNKVAEGAPIGNTIKLTCWNFVEAEEACEPSIGPSTDGSQQSQDAAGPKVKAIKDWEPYLPR